MQNVRLATLEDRQRLEQIWALCFPEDSAQYRQWHFQNRFSPERTFLATTKNEEKIVVSDLQLMPYKFQMRYKIFEANFVVGAATDPEFQGRGLMKEILKHTFETLKKAGQCISMLYPFNYGFYRKMGYEVCSNTLKYSLSPKQANDLFNGFCKNKQNYTQKKLDSTEMLELYEIMSDRFETKIVRNEKDCKNRIDGNVSGGDSNVAIYCDGKIMAYALFAQNQKTIICEEILYYDFESLFYLINELCQKNVDATKIVFSLPITDALHSFFGDDRGISAFEPHCMLRILDVEKTISQMSFEMRAMLNIEIVDNFLPQNSGVYKIEFGPKSKCEKTTQKPQASCSIGTLARLLCGNLEGQAAIAQGLLTTNCVCATYVFAQQNSFTCDMY